MRPIGFRPLLATAAMVALVATACGTRTSSQELLRAALRETQTGSATQPGGVTPGDAGPALDQTGAAPASDGAVASPDAGGANVGSLPRGGSASAGSAASASPAATPRGANPAGGRSAMRPRRRAAERRRARAVPVGPPRPARRRRVRRRDRRPGAPSNRCPSDGLA